MQPGRGERIQTALNAPMQVGAQVRLGVNSRLALEPGQIGGCGQPDRIEAWRGQNLSKAHGRHRPTIRPSFRAVEDRRSGADRSELAESRMFARPHTYVPTSASIRHLRASDGYSTEEVWRARSPTMCARPGRDQLGRADVLCGSIAAFAARRSPRKWIVNRPRVSMSGRRMARSAGRPTSSRRRRSQRFGRRITRVVVGTGGRLMVACPPRPS